MNFYKYLTQVKNNGSFNHSLIINVHHCSDYLTLTKMYLKALVCKEQNPYCDKCFYCNKINHNAYVDLIFLDNNDEHKIGKQDIIDIQQRFILPATEATEIKLYAITNIDQANKQTLNSLLKFIEEAPKNTYNLFFCVNPEMIINTIRSRSNLIIIDDTLNIDDPNTHIIDQIFNDYNEYLSFKENYDLEQLINLEQQLNHFNTIVEEIELVKQMSNLSRYEFSVLLKIISCNISIDKKQEILNFVNDLKLNMNQKNMIIKLIQIIKR